jgi:hypothetical protein
MLPQWHSPKWSIPLKLWTGAWMSTVRESGGLDECRVLARSRNYTGPSTRPLSSKEPTKSDTTSILTSPSCPSGTIRRGASSKHKSPREDHRSAARPASPLLADALFLLREGARVSVQSIGCEGPAKRLVDMLQGLIASHTKPQPSAHDLIGPSSRLRSAGRWVDLAKSLYRRGWGYAGLVALAGT